MSAVSFRKPGPKNGAIEPPSPPARYERRGTTILLLRGDVTEHELPICHSEKEAEALLRLLSGPWP
jgi:hypothetical protein